MSKYLQAEKKNMFSLLSHWTDLFKIIFALTEQMFEYGNKGFYFCVLLQLVISLFFVLLTQYFIFIKYS